MGHKRSKENQKRQNVTGSHQVIEPIDITNVFFFLFPDTDLIPDLIKANKEGECIYSTKIILVSD